MTSGTEPPSSIRERRRTSEERFSAQKKYSTCRFIKSQEEKLSAFRFSFLASAALSTAPGGNVGTNCGDKIGTNAGALALISFGVLVATSFAFAVSVSCATAGGSKAGSSSCRCTDAGPNSGDKLVKVDMKAGAFGLSFGVALGKASGSMKLRQACGD